MVSQRKTARITGGATLQHAVPPVMRKLGSYGEATIPAGTSR